MATSRWNRTDVEPVPLVERLAYVLNEWEESHAGWQAQTINGRDRRERTEEEVAKGVKESEIEPYEPLKAECECRLCKDTRIVLKAYEERGGER